jgi:hypothetical protein
MRKPARDKFVPEVTIFFKELQVTLPSWATPPAPDE